MDNEEKLEYYRRELITLAEQSDEWKKYNKLYTMFPEHGKYARKHYEEILNFFAAGSKYHQRALIAPNRVGKSEGASFEVVCHALGWYPDWWTGARFDHPVLIWACGYSAEKVKEVVQAKLLGEPGAMGTGMIPKDCILSQPPAKPGTPEGYTSVQVPHCTNGVQDGISRIVFKEYKAGPKAFDGKEVEVIWLDEEPPWNVMEECHMRLATTNGQMIFTYTPLAGATQVSLKFAPNGYIQPPEEQTGYTFAQGLTWDKYIPHLTQAMKDEIISGVAPHTLAARTRGQIVTGIGAVWPLNDEEIEWPDFVIPEKWPRFYGVDWGYQRAAACFFAIDPNSDRVYLYAIWESKRNVPDLHVAELKAYGCDWMTGASESSGLIYTADKASTVIPTYIELGLNLFKADKSWQAGIQKVWQYLSTGKLKVFKSLRPWFGEKNLYTVDENNKETTQRHDWMDATRYGIMSGIPQAIVNPKYIEEQIQDDRRSRIRNPITGY